jgi:hypothetical protein
VPERLCWVVRVEAQLVPLVDEGLSRAKPWFGTPLRAAIGVAPEDRCDVSRREVLMVPDNAIHLVPHVAVQHLGGDGVVVVVTTQLAHVVHERRDNELVVRSGAFCSCRGLQRVTELVDREPVVHAVEHLQEPQDAVGERAVYGNRNTFRRVPLLDRGLVQAGDALHAHNSHPRTAASLASLPITTGVPIRQYVRVRVRAMAYLGAIALLGCTACGDVEPPQDGAADRALTTTPVIASHVPIADLTKFSETVAQAPRWAVARRGGPTPFASQLAETTGAVRGTVVGLRAGPPTQSSPEDALGIEDPTGSGTTLMLQDAHLMVEVSDTFGPGAAGVQVGDVVAVPIPIWLSGSAGLTDDDFAAPAVQALEDATPLGAPTVVLISEVSGTTDTPMLDVAAATDWSSLSAVVFEASDGTLFGLDYLIQTHADDHYNVDTLDELAAVAAARA